MIPKRKVQPLPYLKMIQNQDDLTEPLHSVHHMVVPSDIVRSDDSKEDEDRAKDVIRIKGFMKD